MERLGVPATVVITNAFTGLAASFATSLGAPGYRFVAVHHPIASLAEPLLGQLADQAVEAVYAHLTV